MFTFQNPRTNSLSTYIVSESRIYELLEVARPHASWFFGNSVLSNGDILIVSEVHPIFLAIPLICGRGNEMYPLDEYFIDTPLQPIAALIKPHFPSVCSAIPFGDTAVWSIDEKKLLN